MIFNPITRGLSIVCLSLAVTNSLSVWGYLAARDDLTTMKIKYNQVEQGLMECVKQKAKTFESLAQDDKQLTVKENKNRIIDKETQLRVKAITNLPTKNCKSVGVVNEKTVYVNIDAPFDNEFIRVYKQYNQDKGSSSSSSR